MSLIGTSKTRHRNNNGFSSLICNFVSQINNIASTNEWYDWGKCVSTGPEDTTFGGVCMPVSGKVISLTISSVNDTNSTIELYKNIIATGIEVECVNKYGIEYCNYNFNAGDKLTMRVKAEDGDLKKSLATIFVKFD